MPPLHSVFYTCSLRRQLARGMFRASLHVRNCLIAFTLRRTGELVSDHSPQFVSVKVEQYLRERKMRQLFLLHSTHSPMANLNGSTQYLKNISKLRGDKTKVGWESPGSLLLVPSSALSFFLVNTYE